MNFSIALNQAGRTGGAIYSESDSVAIANSVLWNNSPNETDGTLLSVEHSLVRFGYQGEGNLSIDPLFVDLANGNIRLSYGSPGIDVGSSVGAPETDILGTPRPQGTAVDMGAFERTPDTRAPEITLLGNPDMTHECGELFSDDGATALDETDGDISGLLVVGGDSVNEKVPGMYTITYDVSDTIGFAAPTVMRTVTV